MNVAFQQALKSLRANPGRTVLTMLGIMIGIGTVILVLSAGAGFNSLISSEVNAYGNNTLFLETKIPPTTKNRAASAQASSFSAAFSGVVITDFVQRDLDDIKKLPNVANDYGMVTGLAAASFGNNEQSVVYYGASAARFQIDQNKLAEGRFYTQAEDDGGAQVVILGSQLATDLFPQGNPLGQIIRVGTLNFQVIGVYASQGAISGADDSLYMPLQTAQKKMLGINYLTVGVVQMQNANLADETVAEIQNLMRYNHKITDPAKDDFTVETQEQALQTFNTIFGGITILLIAIAAISLLVGGVGIMNIMYVVVTERTAEIGLKKALGAEDRDILREFLIEAVLVTILGGIVGIAMGAGLGWVIAKIATANGLAWTFSVPFYAIALACGVSAAIGIGFGVLPARSAAKLDPIEALRYE